MNRFLSGNRFFYIQNIDLPFQRKYKRNLKYYIIITIILRNNVQTGVKKKKIQG